MALDILTPEAIDTRGLVVLDETTGQDLFKVENGLDPTLTEIRRRIDAWLAATPPEARDATTAAGRRALRSMAMAVARSKTYLEEIGKSAADEAKALPKKIDANRRAVKETLDGWRDELRGPADEWEASEQARIDRHLVSLDLMENDAKTARTAGRVDPPRHRSHRGCRDRALMRRVR